MEIQSVQQYLDLVCLLQNKYTYVITPQGKNPFSREQVFPAKFIFRGHSNNEEYTLLPGILRWRQLQNGSYTTEFSQLEYTILFDFISEACGVVKDIRAQEVVPWLETAQHYGVPTRLLDFTANPLVALYFACVSSPDKDASVWVVNESAYKRVFFDELTVASPVPSDLRVGKIIADEIVNQDYQQHNDPARFIQFPWIYKPFYRNERMNSQSSIFMLWAANRGEFTSFMQPEHYMTDDQTVENQAMGIICPIIVPRNKKNDILDQLDMCGVNEKFIYPGLDGIGRFIRKKYSYNA